ncbi:MAG: nitroreductase family protein [Cytophagales bacterium]|nr:nitroreductase family protein [Cytophaga sp.]
MNTIKEAVTERPVHSLILKRWSARSFNSKEITEEELNTILEAASWAPSAMNEQPWRYVAALKQHEAGFKAILECLVPGNALWAKAAAALLVCYTKRTYTQNDHINVSADHDTGMANQNLLLQALSMNIYGHIMGGFDKEKTREAFQLGEDFDPLCVIALGYLGEADQLEEPFKGRETTPRVRKAMNEFVTFL